MPLRAVARLSQRLSTYYYNYGKKCASRTYLLLLFSLSFIAFFSYPTVKKTFQIETPNIPLHSLDAQIWQSSVHVQYHNFTLFRHPPSSYLITQQIRISQPENQVGFELIRKASSIYEAITTSIVELDHGMPVSLSTICYKHQGRCLIYQPPFRSEKEWLKIHSLNRDKYNPLPTFANVTFDNQGRFLKADGILLTFVLKQQTHVNTLRIWNAIWEKVQADLNIVSPDDASATDRSTLYSKADIVSHMIQYKFKILPFDLSYKVQLSIVLYIVIFYLVSLAFGKSSLVRSGHTFGLAAIFLSIACFTTTWGIFHKLGIQFNSVPWYLLLLTVNMASLENVFLLTNAVLYAGCDMIVTEKISRGLQSVGVPMTITLIAEIVILSIGRAMDVVLIQEFCLFAKVALLVDYVLEMTFVIAVLSIDIKRVELADLDDRQISKRLHELANCDEDTEQPPDYCPIQDKPNKEESKSCAECKDFKTHRAFNSLMLCLIVLSLSFFYPQRKESSITDTDAFSSAFFPTHTPQPTFNTFDPTLSTELNKLSNQFWTIVNPDKNTMCLQMQPPHLVIYPSASEHSAVKQHIDQLQAHYQAKSLAVRNQYKTAKNPPSLFRLFVLSVLQNTLVFMLGINIPSLLLCLVMICIIIWMTPAWREQWLMPFIKRSFEESVRALIRALPLKFVNLFFFKGASQNHPVVTKSLEYEPDGIQHRGAITVQNLFNQQQYRANVKQVRIKTLSRQHMADIQQLDANARKSLVSCGQDGRILLWDAEKANWMARLDKSNPAYGGVHQAHLNPEYFPNALQVKNSKQKAKKVIPFLKQRLSKALCIKVDQGNKWVAAGYDDGIIRIWNVTTGVLVRELDVNHVPVQVQHEPDQEQGLRRRFSIQSSSSSVSSHGSTDRTLHLQFIGAITEFCHPIVAQAAARCRSNDLEASQNFIVSVHKSGVIREWDILSCECIKTIKTGHTRDITQLRVVDSKAPHRKQGITWVFTASKDGTLRCWERSRPSKPQQFEDYNYDEDVTLSTQWTFLYKIDLSIHGPITSIATELPVGGMGVLVTGSGDGTVKVWNFETGEAVATLSVGRYHKSSLKEHPLGPMRHFSKFSSNALYNSKNSKQFGTDEYLSSGSCNSSVIGLDDSEYGHQHSVSTPSSLSDHTGSINQVTVTRYCEVENGPGVCRACDTCFGNGFLVASSASDNKVHSWRLERADSNHEGSCTLCTKDYHRKQYKHRKSSTAGDDDIVKPTGRRKRSSSVHKNLEPATSPRKVVRHIRSLPKSKNPAPATENEFGIELLDIEQLGGDLHIPLTSSFLGVVDQPAGRGLVFCDKILAGVRRVQNGSSEKMEGEWEAWFASLQYYDPGTDEGNAYIPVETFRLDDQSSGQDNDIVKSKQDAANGQSLLHIRETVLGLFGNTAESTKKPAVNKVDQLKYKHIHAPVSLDGIDDDQDDDDYMTEASEILPFSTIRHVIPLDGSGLACDFGNFIKLVYLDKPSHTEKELMKLSQEGMTTTSTNKIVGKNIGLDKVEEVPDDENCSCEQTGDECSPSTKGKDGCCGGVNKEKNGGKCCGGTKTRNKNQTDRKLLKQQQLSGLNAHNAVNCSIRNNCPRASECAPTVTPISPFGSWL